MSALRRKLLLLAAIGAFAVLGPVGLAASACVRHPLPPCPGKHGRFTASSTIPAATCGPPPPCSTRGPQGIPGKTGARGPIGHVGKTGSKGVVLAKGLEEVFDSRNNLLHGCGSPLGFMSRAPLCRSCRDPLRSVVHRWCGLLSTAEHPHAADPDLALCSCQALASTGPR